ncbi:MAG: hypothetical protein ABR906_03415 [Terracidiphilus sp.]|jgi:hypothetical protein
MEADWEFEVGGSAPVIEAYWAGFVDLRGQPDRAWDFPECAQLPALAGALARMNDAASPVWTAKCDFWPHLETDEFDPDELDAQPGCAVHVMGCYIDLLPKSAQQWSQPEMASAACKCVCGLLHAVPLRCCRVDLVIRRASIVPEWMELGITAYLISCGESQAEAALRLQAALAALTGALQGQSKLE